MTQCPTQHRNARIGASEQQPALSGDRRPVVLQWAWCPDCRTVIKRVLVIEYTGVWEPMRQGDTPPDGVRE